MNPKIQYRCLVNLTKVLTREDYSICLVAIAAYAAILGEVSEKNLVNIFRYASIDFSDPLVIALFGFYTKTGLIRIKDNGMSFSKSLKKVHVSDIYDEVDEDIVEEAREIMDQLRRGFLENE